MKISKLETKYSSFHAPAFEISIDGKNILKQNIEITDVTVENFVEGMDTFSFTVNNIFDIQRREPNFANDFFSPGKTVVIKMGYVDKLVTVITGVLTSNSFSFTSDALSQLVVSGFDLSFYMKNTQKTRSWDNVTHSNIVRTLASEYGLSPKVDDTEVIYPKVMQDNESDLRFLTRLAKKNYFEFFVSGKNLYFRVPPYKKNPILTLEWGEFESFSPEVNIAEKVTKVEVRGWDPRGKKEIVARAQKKASGRQQVVEVTRKPVFSQQEAQRMADSILNKHNERLVTAIGESIGLPEIMAGQNIGISGLGNKFSRDYYIEKTVHTINGSGYRTTFYVKENTL